MRHVVFGLIVLVLSDSAWAQHPWLHPYRPTTMVHGLAYCAKHHIPTISVIAYHSIQTHDKLVLVHDYAPRALKCTDDCPNRLADDSRLNRTSVHPMRGRITFCARCTWEYYHCLYGARPLSDSDVQQITSLVTHDATFHKPILHIFAVYGPNAVAVGGRDERVGDVFTDVGLGKRHGKWRVTYAASSHRVVAIGRDDL